MFNQKTAFITGASSGLGRALAIELAGQGARLILMARSLDKLQQVAEQCQKAGSIPLLIQGDVACESDCVTAITNGVKQFGKIDYLILNAGISMWKAFNRLPDLSILRQVMETNYFGAVNCTHASLPHLNPSRAMIVVISSIQGKLGAPYHTGYAASKHALQGFYDSLRMELNDTNIDILTVCPGWIRETALKQHALGYDHQSAPEIKNKHDQSALPMEYCVKEILRAVKKRKRDLALPKHYHWVPLLKTLSPRLLDFLVARKV